MPLLLGTLAGLYRVPDVAFDQYEKVLDGRCTASYFPRADTLLARADGVLYESADEGRTWSQVPTPDGRISAVHLAPDGDRLYVAVQSDPVSIHVSTDFGETWAIRSTFPDVPELTHYVPQQDAMVDTPQSVGVSRLTAPAALPERLVAGFDPAGVHVSDDGGDTWTERSYGLSNDVHDLAILTPTQYLAACWGGLHRTGDAGRSWANLVSDQGVLKYQYFTCVTVHDGSIYTAAAADPPGTWGGDLGINAILLESHDFGTTFEQVPYPGGPGECLMSLVSLDGRVVGGTMSETWDGRELSRGRIVVRTDHGSWETTGHVPAGVTGITPA